VNEQEHAMATAIYEALTEQEKRQVRMFGATREDVDAAVDSYLETLSPKQVVMHMLMSAWRELNWGQVEDARQTLNRVKVTIQRFYTGDERGFFFEPEGQAYSILSDAQHLMEYEDIVRAKMCIDEAHQMIEQGVNI
jgi:uncharacterized protein YcgL (UPF0745 family)